ncbi:hypothetical protein JXA12_05070 [Candidatus Woesearchaeota archaeon]|nr:hypothetical protein [Candidatus Woesearchaeota archaeon]
MKRRIIKQGHNTLTITLPREWTRSHHLEAGDEVDLTQQEHALIINGHEHDEKKTCEIDLTGFTMPLLWRYLQGAYRAGCDEITIYFDPHKKEWEDAYHYYTTHFEYSRLGEKTPLRPTIAMLQETVNRFIGIDIIETGKTYCKIKEMAAVSHKEFENSLRRIFITLNHLFERIIEAIEKDEIGNPNLCKEIHTIDLSIDKFVDYCARILNKVPALFPEHQKQLIFSSLFILELAGDEFKYVGKHLATTSESAKEVLPLARIVKHHFDLYYKLYYAYQRDLAVEFGKHDVKLYEKHFTMKEGLSGENRSIVKHFMLLSKFILGLAELRIQMEFQASDQPGGLRH